VEVITQALVVNCAVSAVRDSAERAADRPPHRGEGRCGLETWTGPLGGAGRIHFLSALQQARYELWNTRVAMEVAFRRARAVGITKQTPMTTEAGYELPHAVCLPIDTPRDKALAQLAVGSPPWGQPK
jgi:hypothetical protein